MIFIIINMMIKVGGGTSSGMMNIKDVLSLSKNIYL